MAVAKKRKTEVASQSNTAAESISSLLMAAGGTSSLFVSRQDHPEFVASVREMALECGWVKSHEHGSLSVYAGVGGLVSIFATPGKLIISMAA